MSGGQVGGVADGEAWARDAGSARSSPAAARDRRAGIVAAALSAVLFGTSYVATSFALRSFSAAGVGLWRGGVAAILLAAVSLAARAAVATRPAPERHANAPSAWEAGRLLRLGALGVLGGTLFILGMNLAVELSGAAIASFVAGLYAVLAAVLARPLLGERLGRGPVAGFVVALAGTALLGGLDPRGASAGGIAAGLVAAVSYALYLVLSRRWSARWRLSTNLVLLSTLACAAVVLLAIELIAEGGAIVPSSIRPDALAAMVWLTLAVSVAAGLLVQAAVRLVDARTASAFLLLNPPTATVAAWLLLGERLAPIELIGGLLVLAGMALAALGDTERG